MITREKINADEEYTLISHMIMNKTVLDTMYRRWKTKELKVQHFSKYSRPIVQWVFRYYGKFKKPPQKTIQKIYESKRRRLAENTQEIIEEYLDRLAEEYNQLKSKNLDIDYIQNEILIDFIRQREIELRIEKAQQKLDSANFEDAEEILSSYSKVRQEDDEEESETLIPFTVEDVEKYYEEKSSSDSVFTFDGDLGKIVGPLEKGWLVAVTGIEKVGKSFILQEIAHQGAVFQKKRVLVINLELDKKMVRGRNQRRISGTAREFDAGRITYPILDCENNQYGTCKNRKRMMNKRPLFRSGGEIVTFSKRKGWKICTKCKDSKKIRKGASKYKRFVPAIWFERERVRETTEGRVKRALKDHEMTGIKNLRIRCYPRFSKTFDEVYAYILRYIDRTGWKPHIIIFDYLDILDDEVKGDERINVDRKWKKGSRMAGELDCLVFTADQATKPSRKQRSLDQMSTSESKTKDGHLDVRIALNQTDRENALGLLRASVIFHRHQSVNRATEVMVVQRLKTSEAIMDSAFWFKRDDNYMVEPAIQKMGIDGD